MKNRIFIVVGMAGSGKTSFCQRLYSWLSQEKCEIDHKTGLNRNIFSINLDPAVLNPKMPLNEDIRDEIDYQEVMEKYNLGPNGAIITSLNLYLLKMDELLNRIEANKNEKKNNIQCDNKKELSDEFNKKVTLNENLKEENSAPSYIIIDTPGQIEAFTWASPGYVLIEGLKSLKSYKIEILYVIDSEQTEQHAVFMSNMMYAASIMCRYQVDTTCVFNKSDLAGTDKTLEWIRDYQKFRESLPQEEMYSSMLSSMALHFEEFYNFIPTVGVSAFTGSGKSEFFKLFNK
ncbi:GPN-loop GTPase 1 [Astathelohania contejeani]|uniref:GPN-loop GTPase n=1 Tax=Astathelohania contejeani TaxID=164912 RepID=A0ABQ7I140_9MICR|nr:GPN-loop GTPase 1 [Thelohania contejeani]